MRLRHPLDYRKVWSTGRSWAHPLLVLWAIPNGLTWTRVGLTASRKIGNAVVRNRARRLLREAARQLYPYMLPGWDMVLVARSALTKANAAQTEAVLVTLLRRANVWTAGDDEP